MRTLFGEALRSGRAFSVLLTDIDHFKHVNDAHGHDAGDAVLKEFSARLRRNTRSVDLACRLGGEEFMIVMPETDRARLSGGRAAQGVRGRAELPDRRQRETSG